MTAMHNLLTITRYEMAVDYDSAATLRDARDYATKAEQSVDLAELHEQRAGKKHSGNDRAKRHEFRGSGFD